MSAAAKPVSEGTTSARRIAGPHTVKLSLSESITIRPEGADIRLDVQVFGATVASKLLDLNATGALIIALEYAAEAAEQARMLSAAKARAA